MTGRDRDRADIARLVAELEDAQRDRDRMKRRATDAEHEAREARDELAQAPATYVAQTDDGRVLYSGEHAASARCAAQNHYWQTRRHVAATGPNGTVWSSRRRGGVR